MKILYDGYIFYLQKAGGVNRYFAEIISRLPESDTPIVYGPTIPVLHRPAHPRLRWLAPPPGKRWLRAPLNRLASGCDVFHPSYYHLTEPLEWSRLKLPVVLTVYDFVFSKYADRYERSEKLLNAQRAAIERADLLLCISHSTQKDLLERFPECENRSIVTYLATSIAPAKIEPVRGERPYFLYVGARVFYKNFDVALRCVALLRARKYDVDLLVVGPGWNDRELKELSDVKAESFVKLVEFPDDEELAGLYQGATALIYPSEYEGFGLPPLEAMTLATPVLALETSSLPEVINKGGILIPNGVSKVEEFADAAESLLANADTRRRYSEAAIRQSARFNWKNTAAATFSGYQRAIKCFAP